MQYEDKGLVRRKGLGGRKKSWLPREEEGAI